MILSKPQRKYSIWMLQSKRLRELHISTFALIHANFVLISLIYLSLLSTIFTNLS